MVAQTKLTVKQYYVVRTIRMGKCAYGVESKGNATGEVNRAVVDWTIQAEAARTTIEEADKGSLWKAVVSWRKL